MSTPENQSSLDVSLDNRLYAVWEKVEALGIRLYNANDAWIVEGRPTTAPRILRSMADGFLEAASELDSVARDIEAADKQLAERTLALGRASAELFAQIERDKLTGRLGEIVRASHRPLDEESAS